MFEMHERKSMTEIEVSVLNFLREKIGQLHLWKPKFKVKTYHKRFKRREKRNLKCKTITKV